jgi:hypothetical protein
MPISATNFSSNSLTGSVVVSGGKANISLVTVPWTLEGDKTFTLSLRTGSVSGPVLVTTPPITVIDNSNVISVTANVISVNEGDLVSFTVTTQNCPDGAAYYSVLPQFANVTSSDFTSNTGSFQITSGTGTFVLQAARDASIVDESGEAFKVQIRGSSTTGPIKLTSTSNVIIADTSNSMIFNSLVSNTNSLVSGFGVRFTLAVSGVGRTLSYKTVGNVLTTDFAAGNTGTFFVNTSNIATVDLYPNPTLGIGETRYFQLQVYETANINNQILSSNTVNVLDTSVYKYTATGGNIITSSGYTYHVFRSSGTFSITANTGTYLGAIGPVTQPIEVLAVAGGGGGSFGFGIVPGNYQSGGGGGAGGVMYRSVPSANIFVGNTMIVTVGGGGNGVPADAATTGTMGGNTQVILGSVTHTIYGGGGGGATALNIGGSGGGGWGGSGNGPARSATGGGTWAYTVNTGPAVGIVGYGYPGGPGGPGGPVTALGGSGGGAGEAGAISAKGGNGISTYSVWLNSTTTGIGGYIAGGGATGDNPGGLGGGAGGATQVNTTSWSGNVNTGGGGAGGPSTYVSPLSGGNQGGGNGGSGLVIIRYPA